MRFDKYPLSKEILSNLAQLNFNKTTDIQYKAITPILRGEDVLAIAQTGTGKTAAFVIPIVQYLQECQQKGKHGLKCIVMVPTRELAIQITEVFTKIMVNTKTKAYCITGGVEQDPQIKQLQHGIDALIATPGRVFDLASQGYIHFDKIDILVLDEADHMLDLGFIKDINDLIRLLPYKRQTLFFSATINDKIKKIAYNIVRNPIRIQISPHNPVAKNIHHTVAHIEMDDKRFFLERMINENANSKILVFVRTKVRAERVLLAMERVGIKSKTIHGDKDQQDRLAVLNEFRNGDVKVLIATDVSARGIDIAHVDFVVNYDLPEEAENYVHRVGRTGRGRNKGEAISFCSKEEKDILAEIEDYIGHEIEKIKINKKDYQETIDFTSDEVETNWKKLLDDEDTKPKWVKKRR